jgi:hypothetical protein
MYDYLIHSDNGLDGPELVGGADTIEEARAIARREKQRDPQRFVTLIDRWDVEHKIEA